jgi:NADH-quinone oxidoreductase subunit M
VALGQRDLRRTLGFVLTSQLALVIVGLAAADTESLHSAMLQMIAMSLTTSGLLLIAAGIQARAGSTEIARFGGLASRFPRMTAAFFLLAIAATGLPGTLQFVAEDLLLHGLLDAHPLVAIVLLVTTVANGITLLRVFFAMFLGEARERDRIGPGIVDLLPRETAVLVALVLLVVAAGAAPQGLIAIRAPGVRAIAIADADAAH